MARNGHEWVFCRWGWDAVDQMPCRLWVNTGKVLDGVALAQAPGNWCTGRFWASDGTN